MKIFISTDIEGATGVVSFAQCGGPSPENYDYRWAREMLTQDVNAAIRGARAGGATEVVVIDGHAGRRNLLVSELEPDTSLITGIGSGTQGMMEGFDATYDAAMLVGYHAKAGVERGVMDHALAGGVHRFWMNSQEVGEIAVSAAVAGAYGKPLILVTSDAAGCAEAEQDIPGVTTYSTKTGFGRYMAHVQHPSKTLPGIEAAAKLAVENLSGVKPLAIKAPVTIRVQFRDTTEVDLACTLENVTRLDGYTIEFTRPDFLTAHRMAYCVFAMAIRGRASGT